MRVEKKGIDDNDNTKIKSVIIVIIEFIMTGILSNSWRAFCFFFFFQPSKREKQSTAPVKQSRCRSNLGLVVHHNDPNLTRLIQFTCPSYTHIYILYTYIYIITAVSLLELASCDEMGML